MSSKQVHLSMFQVKKLEFASEMDGPVSLNLRVRPNITVNRPSDDDFTKGLIKLEVLIEDERGMYLALHAVAELIFSFDKVEAEAFDDFMLHTCGPAALREFSSRLDTIIEAMGFPPLHLELER